MKEHTIRYFDRPSPGCTAGVLEAPRQRRRAPPGSV